MSEHTWVKHVVTPIEVIVGSDGVPQPFVDPELDETCGLENVVYGCMACGEALSADAHGTPCPGPEEESTTDGE